MCRKHAAIVVAVGSGDANRIASKFAQRTRNNSKNNKIKSEENEFLLLFSLAKKPIYQNAGIAMGQRLIRMELPIAVATCHTKLACRNKCIDMHSLPTKCRRKFHFSTLIHRSSVCVCVWSSSSSSVVDRFVVNCVLLSLHIWFLFLLLLSVFYQHSSMSSECIERFNSSLPLSRSLSLIVWACACVCVCFNLPPAIRGAIGWYVHSANGKLTPKI